jgi:hypothetical protein
MRKLFSSIPPHGSRRLAWMFIYFHGTALLLQLGIIVHQKLRERQMSLARLGAANPETFRISATTIRFMRRFAGDASIVAGLIAPAPLLAHSKQTMAKPFHFVSREPDA